MSDKTYKAEKLVMDAATAHSLGVMFGRLMGLISAMSDENLVDPKYQGSVIECLQDGAEFSDMIYQMLSVCHQTEAQMEEFVQGCVDKGTLH